MIAEDRIVVVVVVVIALRREARRRDVKTNGAVRRGFREVTRGSVYVSDLYPIIYSSMLKRIIVIARSLLQLTTDSFASLRDHRAGIGRRSRRYARSEGEEDRFGTLSSDAKSARCFSFLLSS